MLYLTRATATSRDDRVRFSILNPRAHGAGGVVRVSGHADAHQPVDRGARTPADRRRSRIQRLLRFTSRPRDGRKAVSPRGGPAAGRPPGHAPERGAVACGFGRRPGGRRSDAGGERRTAHDRRRSARRVCRSQRPSRPLAADRDGAEVDLRGLPDDAAALHCGGGAAQARRVDGQGERGDGGNRAAGCSPGRHWL